VSALQAVILAAGKGTRLGRPLPKPLTALPDGRSIMAQQVDHLRAAFGPHLPITAVVGFKAALVMEAMPSLLFAYNEDYDSTNTSKSLLRALRVSAEGPVLWLNGDVVFDRRLLDLLRPSIEAGESAVCVNTAAVGEEEVKYAVDAEGWVAQLSKTVVGGLGEAVGINLVGAADKDLLVEHLAACADDDYFERGIETAIAAGMRVRPIDISAFPAVEVDFEEDLARAVRLMAEG
jgi:choline kinase